MTALRPERESSSYGGEAAYGGAEAFEGADAFAGSRGAFRGRGRAARRPADGSAAGAAAPAGRAAAARPPRLQRDRLRSPGPLRSRTPPSTAPLPPQPSRSGLRSGRSRTTRRAYGSTTGTRRREPTRPPAACVRGTGQPRRTTSPVAPPYRDRRSHAVRATASRRPRRWTTRRWRCGFRSRSGSRCRLGRMRADCREAAVPAPGGRAARRKAARRHGRHGGPQEPQECPRAPGVPWSRRRGPLRRL